jgi:hypothetical protein
VVLQTLSGKLRRCRLAALAAIAFAVLALPSAASADLGLGVSLPALSASAIPVPLPPLGAPADTVLPLISGATQAGQTASCSPGSWTGSPTTYAYTWQLDGTDIAGATGSTYTLAAGDVGHLVTCTVDAANALGLGAPAISLPIIPITPPGLPVPVSTSPPAISGNPAIGQPLTCSSGTWSNNPTSYTYAWQRAGAIVSGATGASYVSTGSDLAQAISCVVVAHNAVGDSAPAFSLPVIAVAAPNGGTGGGGGTGKPGSGGGKKPTKLLAPVVKSLSVSPGRMTITVRGKRQTTPGATFRYAIDKKAAVLIYVERRLVGRVNGRSCAAVNKRNAHARHCTRYVRVASFRVNNAGAGSHTLKYRGRQGKGLVPSGGYTVFAAAQNAAGWSRLRYASFAVARKHVKVQTRRPARHRK